jgi:histidine triad (HIT) family protein
MEKENCIFCKIIKNEIPSEKIYEDEKVFAFMDIKPVSEGHILLIPKDHTPWMQDVSDETIEYIFKKAKNLMQVLKQSLNCDFVQLSIVGEEVPHFHIHLIPRYFDDNLPRWITKNYTEDEIREYAEKIKTNI